MGVKCTKYYIADKDITKNTRYTYEHIGIVKTNSVVVNKIRRAIRNVGTRIWIRYITYCTGILHLYLKILWMRRSFILCLLNSAEVCLYCQVNSFVLFLAANLLLASFNMRKKLPFVEGRWVSYIVSCIPAYHYLYQLKFCLSLLNFRLIF